ncbi:3-hydroxyisobutyrate dehydrogenase [Nocardioides marmotae]|uniref:3-hydroxyisobutyrate dehydrogenase n=1 Tax=Nocardioides marmotae TaxID=2663857 RepID=A0A6I3JE35_9ACTN|nr:3-hydroxyisobutyrate dehydrogenase [Nocardioides marmotae]MCR6032794.1 3-hydroxyisobutyrate dehydrogenase [Gordonia jinghuaiqii]MBC9735573.1 3-hydroxyisobutyrate dehydrogenase [Nocardioides marmotae]MTB86669.1 3-hydroxyisobutyrate dehydrogenase [Nocardioides marmotae]MTB96444.1 3-hydroxyisobutyrate dehydrogenase [Nocardioides marmotae]QKE02030.1 3-hydroxyisobutyrate dehydrogenase [Nocardioides marmotae]
MSTTPVAFIGLGNMGGPMAANLVKAGHPVTGFDVGQEACDKAREAGVDVKATAAEAVQGAAAVVTMLPNGALLLQVYDEVLAAAAPGTLFVDCSTVAVSDARTAADLAVAAGHRAADAPVSGGVGGAEAGSLTFMLGCDDALVEETSALLEPMAGRVVHCGASGAGQAAKICNNMVLGASMIAISEAFVLGEKLGLTHQAFFDVASTASGQCWALTTNCPVPGPVPTSPANRDWKPGFAGALMAKDLGLARRALEESGTDAAVGTLAEEIYRRFADEGGAGLDFSAIVNTIRERSAATAG